MTALTSHYVQELLYVTGVVPGKVIKYVVAARKQDTVLRNIRHCIGALVIKMIASS
jgi:hypothetical protein